jgi:hypothetical protein
MKGMLDAAALHADLEVSRICRFTRANDLISSSVSGSPHSAAFSNRSVSKTKAASFGAISTTRIVIA